MKRFKFLLVFIVLIIFSQNPLYSINASSLDEEEAREGEKIQNEFFSIMEVSYKSLGLVEPQTSSNFLALPSPPAWAIPHQLNSFGDLATVWFWNEETEMYIHVKPSGSCFLCGGQFLVTQNNTQYIEIKIETEGGDSFCGNSVISQTYYFTQWSFISERFNPTQPLTISFDTGDGWYQFIDYVPNAISTSSTTTAPTTTTAKPTTSTTASSGICPTSEIYGEYSRETETLRHFRDNILAQTPEGQELIKLYYQWSPVIVKAMEKDEEFKEEVKEVIDEILMLIKEEAE